MTPELKKKCDDLIVNYTTIYNEEKWVRNTLNMLAGASLFMASEVPLDLDIIYLCKKILKQKEGIFSEFRSFSEYITCCKMAINDNPEGYYRSLKNVSEQLNPGIFRGQMDVLAAMVIVDNKKNRSYTRLVSKTMEAYSEMNATHFFLTSKNDLPFAALMAVTSKDTHYLHQRAERAFTYLKKKISVNRDTLQTISHILSLYNIDIEVLCDRLIETIDILKTANCSLGAGMQAAILAAAVSSDMEPSELAYRIVEADEYIAKYRPFKGIAGVGGYNRRMFAALCVQCAYFSKEQQAISTTITTTIQLIIVINITMMIIASQAASSSSR